MKKPIENRDDLRQLITTFYDFLLTDAVIGHFFEAFHDDQILENHIVTLIDFWDNLLFYSGTYTKNAMQPHLALNNRIPMKKIHFDRWITLFNKAVDKHFTGAIAHAAKTRAHSIATVMQIKVVEASKK